MNSFTIPRLAKKLSLPRLPSVSLASIMSNFLFPGLTILFLEGDCFAHWKSLWRPCRVPGTFAAVKVVRTGGGDMQLVLQLHEEMCTARSSPSPADCARSLALKLQDLYLKKLTASALVLPAGRLLLRWLWATTDDLVLHLCVILELAVLLGGPLPSMAPFLCIGAFSCVLLGAISLDTGGLRLTSEPGDVRSAVRLAA